jgi:hypothetical protein
MKISLDAFRSVRDAIVGIMLNRLDDAIQPMDARLAANEMTEAAFDVLDPSLDWRKSFESEISALALD